MESEKDKLRNKEESGSCQKMMVEVREIRGYWLKGINFHYKINKFGDLTVC